MIKIKLLLVILYNNSDSCFKIKYINPFKLQDKRQHSFKLTSNNNRKKNPLDLLGFVSTLTNGILKVNILIKHMTKQ